MTLSTSLKRSRPITFVICAAGKGERFLKHGLKTPKPNLVLEGKTMLERAIESLKLQSADQLIIVANSSHDIKKSITFAEVIEVDFHTRGQLETFMLASQHIKHNEVVIYNCDTYFESNELNALIENGADGIIPCSIQPGESWSFCQIDEEKNVISVAEKKRISPWASVGYYYFKNKELLFELAREELKSVSNHEVYVAPLYERYIQKGLNIKLAEVDLFRPFGTIEQIKDYWGISIEEFAAQNS